MLQRLWENKIGKEKCVRQGIISNHGCTENCIKLRIDAKDKSASNAQDNVIANTYGDKFVIHLDFEMLDSEIPYYQSRLGNGLCYGLTFNKYNQVITSAGVKQDSSVRFRTYS